jgi:hypothetical protein
VTVTLSEESFDNLSGAAVNFASPAAGNFTLRCEAPCAVMYTNGTDYIRIPAVSLSDGSYAFSLPADYDSSGKIAIRLAGDLNGDGEVDSTDALQTLRCAAELRTYTAIQLLTADLDGDHTLSSVDALQLLRLAAGLRMVNW